MADLPGGQASLAEAEYQGSMLNILTQDALEAATPAVVGSKFPVLDLDTFSQDEFVQLAEVCTGLDQEHIRTQELLDPKLDRRLGFNESAGSRKQTFRDHPSSKNQRLRRDGEADVGRSNSVEPLRAPGYKVPGALNNFLRESSPPRRRGRPPRPPCVADIKPRPLLPGSPVELGVEVATHIEEKDLDTTSDEDPERASRKRTAVPEVPGSEGEVSEGEKQNKKAKSVDEKSEAQDDQSRARRGKQSDTSEAKLFEFLKNMVGRWTSDHRRRKIVAANGFPSGWTVCVGLRQKHGRYYFEYRDYTDPEGKTWSSFKEAAAHLVTVAEQSIMSEKDTISDISPQPGNDSNLTSAHEPVELEDKLATPSSTGRNPENENNISHAADDVPAIQHEVPCATANLGVTYDSTADKLACPSAREISDRVVNFALLPDEAESGRPCETEVQYHPVVEDKNVFSADFAETIAYRCPVCREEFQTQQKLRAHIVRLCHMQNFACDVCGHIFQSDSLLLKHRIKKNHSRSFTRASHAAMEVLASDTVGFDKASLPMKGDGTSPGLCAVDGVAGSSAGSITRASGKEGGKQWDLDLTEISSHAGPKQQLDGLQQPDIGNLLCPQWPCTGNFASPGVEEEMQHEPGEGTLDENKNQEADWSNKSSNSQNQEPSQIGRDHGQDLALLQQVGGPWRTRTRSANKEPVSLTEATKKIKTKSNEEVRKLAANAAVSSSECVREIMQADERASHQDLCSASRFWLYLKDSPSKVLRRTAAAGLPRDVPTSVSTFKEQAVIPGGLEANPEKASRMSADKPHFSHKLCQTTSPLVALRSSEACNHCVSSSTEGPS